MASKEVSEQKRSRMEERKKKNQKQILRAKFCIMKWSQRPGKRWEVNILLLGVVIFPTSTREMFFERQ